MNFNKDKSKKILSAYLDNNISKGKRAEIGEVRTWQRGQVVKHSEGWLFMRKNGQYFLQRSDGSIKAASSDQISHFKKHSTQKDISSKLVKERQPTSNKVKKTLASNVAIKTDAENYKSSVVHILNVTKPIVDNVLKHIKETFEKSDLEFKNDEKRLQQIGITYELISSITSYLEPSDKIVNYEFENVDNRMIASFLIERNGEEIPLETEVITAGGYNIQQLHTRYITKTPLIKKKTNFFTDKEGLTKDEIKRNDFISNMYKGASKINANTKEINKLYQNNVDLINLLDDLEDTSTLDFNLVDVLKSEELKPLLDRYDLVSGIQFGSNAYKFLQDVRKHSVITNAKKRDESAKKLETFELLPLDITKIKENLLSSINKMININNPNVIKVINDNNKRITLSTNLPDTVYTKVGKKSWDLKNKEFILEEIVFDKNKNKIRSSFTDSDIKNIDYNNKTIVLENPKTGGSEMFYYNRDETIANNYRPVFIAKKGLKIVSKKITIN